VAGLQFLATVFEQADQGAIDVAEAEEAEVVSDGISSRQSIGYRKDPWG